MATPGKMLRRLAIQPTSSTRREAWIEILSVAAILALAIALRFTSIGSRSFTADEAFSAYKALQPLPAIVAVTGRDDAHPPLYYIVLSFWRQAFGADDIALRSLGATASVLTVAGTYVVARFLGGWLIAILATFLGAISPFQILTAQETRMYALFGLFTLLSWATLLAAVQGRRWGWIAYVGATVLALYTHYFAFLNVIGQGVFVLLTATRSRRAWCVSQLVILGLLLPWLGKVVETIVWFHPFSPTPLEGGDLTTFLGFLNFGGHAFGFGGWFVEQGTAPFLEQAAILAPFLVLTAFGVVTLWEHPRSLWFTLGYLFVPVAIVAVLSLRAGIFHPRYFSFLSPPFTILMAFGIVRLAQRLAPARHHVAALALGLLVFLFNIAGLEAAHSNPKHNVFNWRAVAALLTKEAGPNDLIVVYPGFDHIALIRYFHGTQRVLPGDMPGLDEPTARRNQDELEIVQQGRAVFRSYAASHEGLWLVIGYQVRQPALVRLQRQLDGIYDVRSVTELRAIRVFRATRKLH